MVEQKLTEPGANEPTRDEVVDVVPPEDVQRVIDTLYEGQDRPVKPDVSEILNPDAINPGREDIVTDNSSRHPDSRKFRVPFFKGGQGRERRKMRWRRRHR